MYPRGWRVLLVAAAITIFLAAHNAHAAATLFITPETISSKIGDRFTTTFQVASQEQAMNAASLSISFPKDLLQLESISKTGSLINLWVQEPSFSNTEGTLSFGGVVLNPGYQGVSGKLLSVTFRSIATGTGQLRIVSGQVLANDGNGTEITGSLGKASVVIKPAAIVQQQFSGPIISSPTHPVSDKWYNLGVAKFTWELPTGAEGATWSVSKSESSQPAEADFKSGATTAEIDLAEYSDGVRYFILKVRKNGKWSSASKYQFRVDRTPPLAFAIQLQRTDATDPTPIIRFKATDELSGIAGYEVRIDAGDWQSINLSAQDNGYRLPPLAPGAHEIKVRAIDNAGNSTESNFSVTIDPIPAPTITGGEVISEKDGPIVAVEGEGQSGLEIEIQGRQGDRRVSFFTTVDANGRFRAEYHQGLTPGTWIFTATAKDSRGAVSSVSNQTSVHINDAWYVFLFTKVKLWVLFILVAVFIIIGIIIRKKLSSQIN